MKNKTAGNTGASNRPKLKREIPRALILDDDTYLDLSTYFMEGNREGRITVIKVGTIPINGWQVFVEHAKLVYFFVEHQTPEDFEQWKGTKFYSKTVAMNKVGEEPEVLIFWNDSKKGSSPIDFVEVRDFSGKIQFVEDYRAGELV